MIENIYTMQFSASVAGCRRLFYITFVDCNDFAIYDTFGTTEAQGVRNFDRDNNKIVYAVKSKGLTNLIANHAIKRFEKKVLKTDKKIEIKFIDEV